MERTFVYSLRRLGHVGNFQLKFGENTLGRLSSNDIEIPSKYASRKHCVITVDAALHKVTIKKITSPNGVFKDNVQYTDGEIPLEVGEEIGIGCTTDSKSDADCHVLMLERAGTKRRLSDTSDKDVNPPNAPASTTVSAKEPNRSNHPVTDWIVIKDSSDSNNELVTSAGPSRKVSKGTIDVIVLPRVKASPNNKPPQNKRKRRASTTSDDEQSTANEQLQRRYSNKNKNTANQEAPAVTKIAVQKPTSAKVEKRPTPPTGQSTSTPNKPPVMEKPLSKKMNQTSISRYFGPATKQSPSINSEINIPCIVISDSDDNDEPVTNKQTAKQPNARQHATASTSTGRVTAEQLTAALKKVTKERHSDKNDEPVTNKQTAKQPNARQHATPSTSTGRVTAGPSTAALSNGSGAKVSSTAVNQPIEYGSEWDTDGSETIKQQQREAAKKKQTANQRNARRQAATKPSATASTSTAAINNANEERSASPIKTVKNRKRPLRTASDDSDDDDALVKTTVKNRKRPLRIASDDSDDDDALVKKPSKPSKSSTSRKPQSATKTQEPEGEDDNNNRAVMQLRQEEINFMGNRFHKTIRRFVCPAKSCRANYSSFLNLKNHFKDVHNQSLERPINTDENNWRRIQNSNRRFDVTTIKQKLRPLLTPINKQPVAAPLAKQKTDVATKLFDNINKLAVEFSKIAILFSSLAYFHIYNTMATEHESRIDSVFQEEIKWKKMLLEFKTFVKKSANEKTPRPPNHKPFFDMCEKFKIQTKFVEQSQNAWHNIADTFAANFKTNITLHLYPRLRNWFRFKLKNGKKRKEVSGKENRKILNDKIYHTMAYLFDFDKCSQPTKVQHQLIAELQKICKFPDFNNGGRSYFQRLWYDYKENSDDGNDNGHSKGKPKRKQKRMAGKATTSKANKKKKKITQDNGPRLIWFQQVLVEAGILTEKKKRKRKRTRPHQKKNIESKPPAPPTNKRPVGVETKKKREMDPESIHHAKLPNFIVVPQNSFHTMHFPIDTQTLFDLVKQLPQFKNVNQAEFGDLVSDDDPNRKTTNPFWYYLFTVRKLETDTKKFSGRITTNGSDVSIQYCKLRNGKQMTRQQILQMARNRKRKSNDNKSDSDSSSDSDEDDDDEDDDEDKKTKKTDPAIVNALQKITNLEDLSVSGVDLGIRNVAATVIRTWDKTSHKYELNESHVLHKSKDYHFKAGFQRRQRKAKKLHGDFDQIYQEDRQQHAEEPSPRSPNYMEFLTSRMKWFNEGTAAYMQRAVTNIKFDKFRSTQIEMTKMARQIAGYDDVHGVQATNTPKKLRLVFLGDCSTPANSKIKGHRRSPGNAPIVRFLKQIPNTLVDATIDEYCTTKKCSRCYRDVESVEYTKDRLKFCQNCKPSVHSMSTNEVSTYRCKREIATKMMPVTSKYPTPTQGQRSQRVNLHRTERWTPGDKFRIAERRNLQSKHFILDQSATKNIYWNRDTNAARNIAHIGLCDYNLLNATKNSVFKRPKKQR